MDLDKITGCDQKVSNHNPTDVSSINVRALLSLGCTLMKSILKHTS